MRKLISVLNIGIHSVKVDELLGQLESGVFVTPNVDHVMKLQKDVEFYRCYQRADWTVCDSRILYLGAKLLRTPIEEVIPGSSFLPRYCDYHRMNPEVKIFLLGAGPGVAQEAMKRINARIGRSIVVGAYSPVFGFEKNEAECKEIVGIINRTDATVLVVGLGAPKQEKWIFNYKDSLTNVRLFMALGATIDFEAGRILRAPQIFQKMGIEWLYRLIKEPRRLWKRYLIDDIPFFYLILKQKIGRYKNPFEHLKTGR